jgi:hypothetical protein
MNVPKYELTISAINDISQMCLPGFAQSIASRFLFLFLVFLKHSSSTHLIFNHISRTGGTSLEKYLSNFAESCNLTSKNFFSYGCKRYSCELSGEEREEIKKSNILFGYQQFGVHSIFPKTVYITMLRHPVSVFVSIVFQAEANMLGQRKPSYSMEKVVFLFVFFDIFSVLNL